MAEGEELGSNLLRVPQGNLEDPGGPGILSKRRIAGGGGRFQRLKGPLPLARPWGGLYRPSPPGARCPADGSPAIVRPPARPIPRSQLTGAQGPPQGNQAKIVSTRLPMMNLVSSNTFRGHLRLTHRHIFSSSWITRRRPASFSLTDDAATHSLGHTWKQVRA
jgi:hypothetical protein